MQTASSKLQKSLELLADGNARKSADETGDVLGAANKVAKSSRASSAKKKDAKLKKLEKKEKRKLEKEKRKRERKEKEKRKKAAGKPPKVIKPKTWKRGAHPKKSSPNKAAATSTDPAATATSTDPAAVATATSTDPVAVADPAADPGAVATSGTDPAATPKSSPRKRKVPDLIELDEGESNDEFDIGDTSDATMATKLLGSKLVDGNLFVFLEWDGDPTKVSLDPIGPAYKDFKTLFDGTETPPRLQKWLDRRPTRKKKKELVVEAQLVNSDDDNSPEVQAIPVAPKNPCLHEDILSLMKEENPAYCGESYYLHGGVCSDDKCNHVFVEKLSLDPEANNHEVKPCEAKPAMVCPNYQHEFCNYALCFDCYSAKLNNVGRTRRHK